MNTFATKPAAPAFIVHIASHRPRIALCGANADYHASIMPDAAAMQREADTSGDAACKRCRVIDAATESAQ